MTRRIKTAVLISGQGSNLAALIEAARSGDFPAVITLVISNKPDAFGIVRATDAGIPVRVIERRHFGSDEAFDHAMDDALSAAGIELICLAGFMRILAAEFVSHWRGRLLNIHPSLLPAHRGLNTHARVLEMGDAKHGATVHWVSEELDAGEIIAQESFLVRSGDTAESLARHVQEIEHRLYPEVLKNIAEKLLA